MVVLGVLTCWRHFWCSQSISTGLPIYEILRFHRSNYARMLDCKPLHSKTFDAVDFAAMEAVATFHRGGKPCRVNKSIYAYDGDNLVLEILSTMIVRLRLHETKFLQPRGDVDKISVTEVATLRFDKIGMLWPADETDPAQESVRVGQIVDQHARIPDFGPFDDSLAFYQTGTRLFLEYYRRRESSSTEEPDFDVIGSSTFKMAAIPYIAEHSTSHGSFFLAHPDFQV
jgi:hypothetical protein